MRITDVTTIKLRFPMQIAMADAIHYMPERPTLLVQVHTDTGLVGLGEAAAYGGFLESTEALITGELRTTILGQDPFKVEQLWAMMATRAQQRGRRGMLMMAISGVDIALWDLIGQATHTPLYRLLGGYQ
ncbi:MAG: mandelate racemase/muconate lactonizing enzyme family protein, partial [Herpetosiphonaceae bacterium]|nr:mandelate racemase/muconate lactonizing enzyme family protein [Herpetosiphonaceae bacterium]